MSEAALWGLQLVRAESGQWSLRGEAETLLTVLSCGLQSWKEHRPRLPATDLPASREITVILGNSGACRYYGTLSVLAPGTFYMCPVRIDSSVLSSRGIVLNFLCVIVRSLRNHQKGSDMK